VNTASPGVDLDVSGAARITGGLNMVSTRINNLVDPSALQDAATKNYVDSSIPVGGIIMWSGVGATLPSNWKLCDGSTYGSLVTPDLRGRFVVGALSVTNSMLENRAVEVSKSLAEYQVILGLPNSVPIGPSVSLSADGMVVAVGTPDDGGSNPGTTRVYRYDSTTKQWNNLGRDIRGSANERSGESVSISADGTTVAIGSPSFSNFQGLVRVYRYNATEMEWRPYGNIINAQSPIDEAGKSVSISANGNIVAVGHPGWNNTQGMVRVYQYSVSTWNNIGGHIISALGVPLNGWSVSLSENGYTVAIGSPSFNNSKGLVKVYRYNSVQLRWDPVGLEILGGDGVRLGSSVSISADGNRLVVGGKSSIAYVYNYNANTNSWAQLGERLLAQAPPPAIIGAAEVNVSISSDGMTVACRYSTTTCVFIYNNTSGGSWRQLGQNFATTDVGPVNISKDGTTVAILTNPNVTRIYNVYNIISFSLAFIMRIS
jgi:hypothetical protein